MLARNAMLLGLGMVGAISLVLDGPVAAAQAYSCAAAVRSCGGATSVLISKRSRASSHCGKQSRRSKAARHNGKCRTANRHQRKRKFRKGEHVVSQISPRSARTGSYRRLCNGTANRHPACRTRPPQPIGLPDALLVAPNRRTEKALKDAGIPAIKDVPPIVILHPDRGNASERDRIGGE
jgi:hypothetical protein